MQRLNISFFKEIPDSEWYSEANQNELRKREDAESRWRNPADHSDNDNLPTVSPMLERQNAYYQNNLPQRTERNRNNKYFIILAHALRQRGFFSCAQQARKTFNNDHRSDPGNACSLAIT